MKEKWTKQMLNMSSHREWHDVSNLIKINLITDANDEVDGACSMKKKQQKQKQKKTCAVFPPFWLR